MEDPIRPDRRKPSPARAWLLLGTYLALIGFRAWDDVNSGKAAGAGILIGIFVVLPAGVYAVRRVRARRITTGFPAQPRPADPRREQRRKSWFVVGLFAVLGVVAILNAKPADRLPTGLIVGVALAIVAFLALPGI